MEVARLIVSRTYASVVVRDIITAGMQGATISVEYAPGIWDGLTKTVVFDGAVSKDKITNDTIVEIPPEVLTEPHKHLRVGFVGMDGARNLVIPTIWADLGRIQPAANPSGDTSTDPGLPVWGQIATRVDGIAKDVDELKRGGVGGGVNVSGATVGQIPQISAVDAEGKPTAWKPIDIPDTDGTQPDWNAAEGEPGHVLNRTHWVETGLIDVLPETTLTTTDPGEFVTTDILPLEAGKTYTVDWNGTEYTCTAVDISEFLDGAFAVGLGNIAEFLEGNVSSEGEPFVIVQLKIDTTYVVTSGDPLPTEVTLSIKTDGENVHRLDNKFLSLDWMPVRDEDVIMPEYTGYAYNFDSPNYLNAAFEIPNSAGILPAIENGANVYLYVNGVPHLATKSSDLDGYYLKTIDGRYNLYALSAGFNAFFAAADEPGSYTIRVTSVEGNRNKIPAEFLPDDIGGAFRFTVKKDTNSTTTTATAQEIDDAVKAGKIAICHLVDFVANYEMDLQFVTGGNATSIFQGSLFDRVYLVTINSSDANVQYETLSAVKTVNGQAPDKNGNVEITIPDTGGSQVDWNANEGEPGHILNRPFWEESSLVGILEGPYEFLEDDGFFYGYPAEIPNVGSTCIVNWNGVEYACVAQDFSEEGSGAVLLGNGELAELAGNDEPFALIMGEFGGIKQAMIIPLDGTTELTLYVYHGSYKIRKLDNRFLNLDWLPKMEYRYEDGELIGSASGSSSGIGACEQYIEGKTYIVYLNGERYETVVKYDKVYLNGQVYNIPWFGNKSIRDSNEPNTGEPFYGFTYNGVGMTLYVLDEIEQAGWQADVYSSKEVNDNRMPEYFLPEIVLTRKELEAIKEAIVDEVLYTDIEAIKGDAKAYILTDYIPNSNTRVVAKAYFDATSTARCLFGARTSTSSLRFDFGNNSSSKYSLGWNASTVNSTIAERTEAFELDVNRNVVYINGEEEVRAPDAEWVAAYPLAIFACNTKGAIATNAPSGATIWWMKIYEGDTLLYDFIPRKHLVDGYGLYDKISKKFYSNANTSGAFTEG